MVFSSFIGSSRTAKFLLVRLWVKRMLVVNPTLTDQIHLCPLSVHLANKTPSLLSPVQ